MKALIVRTETGRYGTFGLFVMPDFVCHTLEPRWRNNERDISCIPAGEYWCAPRESTRYGKTYHVLEVQDRDAILFHVGNWAGEGSMRCNSEGCILLGAARGKPEGQDGILDSKKTIQRFVHHTDREPFRLLIVDRWEEG